MQWRDAPARETEDQSKEEKSEVDGDIPFAQSNLVACFFIADKLAGFNSIQALGIA